MFHGPLTSFKRQGVIRLVFRFHLRRRKLSFMLESSTVLAISRIRLMDKSGPTVDGQIRSNARYYGTLATSRPLWVRAYTVVTFWSSWSISLLDIEPHIYHNSMKIVPRAIVRT